MPAAPPSPPSREVACSAGRLLIRVSLIAYVLSFALPTFQSNAGSGTFLGMQAFFVGLCGLFLFQPAWLANPAFWLGVTCAARQSWTKAPVCGVVAAGFALGVLLIYDPGAAPAYHDGTSLSSSDGWTSRLTELLPGYWCWLASMVLFLSGSVMNWRFLAPNGLEHGSCADCDLMVCESGVRACESFETGVQEEPTLQ